MVKKLDFLLILCQNKFRYCVILHVVHPLDLLVGVQILPGEKVIEIK